MLRTVSAIPFGTKHVDTVMCIDQVNTYSFIGRTCDSIKSFFHTNHFNTSFQLNIIGYKHIEVSKNNKDYSVN